MQEKTRMGYMHQTTILPQPEKLKTIIQSLTFHDEKKFPEVALRVSQAILMSSDRMKPRSED
uniref:Uncharacterized protein n=1 Tax=Timema tahoe TaxID=61484 RepID=A0A7R9FGX8_9NEOP|nr:unnamed protein product [Timema tahoe]